MSKDRQIDKIKLLANIIEKGKGNPHYTAEELNTKLQDECDDILYDIPLENIMRHLMNNRCREILIPNYFLPEHIIQEAKERFDIELADEEAKDLIEDLSNADGLSEQITETMFEYAKEVINNNKQ